MQIATFRIGAMVYLHAEEKCKQNAHTHSFCARADKRLAKFMILVKMLELKPIEIDQ